MPVVPPRPSRLRPRRAGATVAAALALTTLAAGCSSSPAPKPVAASPTTSAPAPSTSAVTPAPTPADTRARSPLTGLPVGAAKPVLAVKIGNTDRERPPIGVEDADVVYVEMVEGGLTRLAAIFSSHLPAQVGPVRSARETDVELLKQYGGIALAFSGAQRRVVPLLRASGLQLVSFDAGTSGYRRDPSRGHAPYNVVGDPSRLIARAPKAAAAKDIGFVFGPASPGGEPAKAVTARYPLARVGASWDGRRWVLSMDGRASVSAGGTRLSASTIVVQYVTEQTLSRHDAAGTPVPYARTVGSGSGLVLRDGRVWTASWSRPSATAPTRWTSGGKPVTFAPGQVWILLVPKGRQATVS